MRQWLWRRLRTKPQRRLADDLALAVQGSWCAAAHASPDSPLGYPPARPGWAGPGAPRLDSCSNTVEPATIVLFVIDDGLGPLPAVWTWSRGALVAMRLEDPAVRLTRTRGTPLLNEYEAIPAGTEIPGPVPGMAPAMVFASGEVTQYARQHRMAWLSRLKRTVASRWGRARLSRRPSSLPCNAEIPRFTAESTLSDDVADSMALHAVLLQNAVTATEDHSLLYALAQGSRVPVTIGIAMTRAFASTRLLIGKALSTARGFLRSLMSRVALGRVWRSPSPTGKQHRWLRELRVSLAITILLLLVVLSRAPIVDMFLLAVMVACMTHRHGREPAGSRSYLRRRISMAGRAPFA